MYNSVSLHFNITLVKFKKRFKIIYISSINNCDLRFHGKKKKRQKKDKIHVNVNPLSVNTDSVSWICVSRPNHVEAKNK